MMVPGVTAVDDSLANCTPVHEAAVSTMVVDTSVPVHLIGHLVSFVANVWILTM